MANTNYKYWGVKPLFMAEARKTSILMPITNNYGTVLGQLDPVVLVTAGTIERGPSATAWLGVAIELFRHTGTTLDASSLLPVQYVPASYGAGYTHFALVTMDPNLFFTMQEDGAGPASYIITDMGGATVAQWTNAVAADAMAAAHGISGIQLDSSDIDATATRPIQVIRPYFEYFDVDAGAYNTVSTNAAGADYCKFIVRIANSQIGNLAVAAALS